MTPQVLGQYLLGNHRENWLGQPRRGGRIVLFCTLLSVAPWVPGLRYEMYLAAVSQQVLGHRQPILQ